MAFFLHLFRGVFQELSRLGEGALGGFRGRSKLRARRAEARGDLAGATSLYVEAGLEDEAARILELRAEAAVDARERHKFLVLAVPYAKEPRKLALRKRCARLGLDMIRSGKRSLLPAELAELGRELSDVGEYGLAAEAHALAGDVTAEARALVDAGEIERLEVLLEQDVKRTRFALEQKRVASLLRDLDAVGQRRQVLKIVRDSRDELDAECQAVCRAVEAKRVTKARVTLEIDSVEREVVFGNVVHVGRSDAEIIASSPAVSRTHLELRRIAGVPAVIDLGSSNGTIYRGARLQTELFVREPIELLLGGEVLLELTPDTAGVWLTIAKNRCFAPLGALELALPDAARDSTDGWLLWRADDGWLEFDSRAKEAFLGGLRVSGRIELCRGDALGVAPGIPPRLRVVS